GTRELGIEWEGIRRAVVYDGFSVYLVPSRDGVCLVPDSPRTGTGLFCRSRDIALAGKLSEPISDRDTRVIVGVVPDGVTEVTVEDDSVRRVPVEGNAYVARVGDGTARISWGGGHVIWPE
ncbi:MAG TPA: hypothetical protein VNO82_07370, partial [Solirubrobacteraceae bacterium]|nr:hypothetical protein [Solirubrobacteraceae bacterium]